MNEFLAKGNREEAPMSSTSKEAAEGLLKTVFSALMKIAHMNDVTSRRMVDLLPYAHVKTLRDQGMTQQEIMGHTGYAIKTIRRILREGISAEDDTDTIARIVGHWASDPIYPNELPINNGHFPTFIDFCDQYGGDFQPASLLRVLEQRKLIVIGNQRAKLMERTVTAVTSQDMLETAAVSLNSLIKTLHHNLSRHEPAFTERRIHSNRIAKCRIPVVREKVRQLLVKHRSELIELLEQEEERGETSPDELGTVGIGIYWYQKTE